MDDALLKKQQQHNNAPDALVMLAPELRLQQARAKKKKGSVVFHLLVQVSQTAERLVRDPSVLQFRQGSLQNCCVCGRCRQFEQAREETHARCASPFGRGKNNTYFGKGRSPTLRRTAPLQSTQEENKRR
jgi:hypothetical protein